MKRLGSRVNLIPVIAKADTLTPKNLQKFKENVSFPLFFTLTAVAAKTNVKKTL